MKKRLNGSFLLALILATGANLGSVQRAEALDDNYLRNGECYLSIGQGTHKGIYRLNNAVTGEYFNSHTSPQKKFKVISDNFNDSMGFAVDLDRNIYTFSEEIPNPTPVARTGNIYRQVLDSSNGMTENGSDYGSWSYHHYDARQVKRGSDIYRTNNQSSPRYIRGSSSIRALGPGTSATKPVGYKLPALGDPTNERDYLALREYSGRNWYAIPNGSWYSSWHRNQYSSTSGYMVYNDTEKVVNHNYHKVTWTNSTPASNDVDYPTTGSMGANPIATSEEVTTERYFVCGCLDSCQADGGTGTSDPEKPKTDIAMQPKLQGSTGDRIYSLSHLENSSQYTLTRVVGTGGAADYSTSSLIRGFPEKLDSYWIGISLRDKDTDYVYVMGDQQVKEWYQLSTGDTPPSDMKITAASVSNQWNQKGGIIYAYDKGKNKVYKFVCEDIGRKDNPGFSADKPMSVIDVKGVVDSMGGDGDNSELDSIKSDGFGNLYMALSFPSVDRSTFNPPEHFRLKDAIHMCVVAAGDGYTKCNFIFPQEYGKVVFKKDVKRDEITEVGRIVYGRTYYHLQVKVSDAVYTQLAALNYPNSSWYGIISDASESDSEIGINGYTFCNISDFARFYLSGKGCMCPGYSEFTGNDPDVCRLAVINVPTPPEVLSIDGTKESFLDIIGPYTSYQPYIPGTSNTNQGANLRTDLTSLNQSTVYFYMVENYPLFENAQDPNEDLDWDGDTRLGGFVSSIQDPYPAGYEDHRGTIRYHWKTWMVEDGYGNPICELVNESSYDPVNVANNDGMPSEVIYSPSKGKYILTCQVDYDWYNYDAILFGETVEVLQDPRVDKKGKFALPSYSGKLTTFISPTQRLSQIKAMSDFAFMENAKDYSNDPDGVPIDYTVIYGSDPNSFWAMEPIVVAGDKPDTLEGTDIAIIEKCDLIRDSSGQLVATSTYWIDDSFWNTVPSDTGYYGLENNKEYCWRINLASQTNLLKDISAVNGVDDPNSTNFNYVASKLLEKNGTDDFVFGDMTGTFQNNVGDVKWQDDWITVSAELEYELPGEGKKTMPLMGNTGTTRIALRHGLYLPQPNPTHIEEADWDKHVTVVATTSTNLIPTDPKDAKIIITLKRNYKCTLQGTYNDPSYGGINIKLPYYGVISLSGVADVRVMDTREPAILWDETSPNNLFGVTGLELKDAFADGSANPTGEPQDKIKFAFYDNNSWESVETEEGLTDLAVHVKNYAYNYGYKACQDYCLANPGLISYFNSVNSEISAYPYSNGVIGEIDARILAKRPSSDLNLRPLFCKKARDIRLAFDTVTRNLTPNDPSVYGRATLISSNTAGLNFDSDSSKYSYNYRDETLVSCLTVLKNLDINGDLASSSINCSINVDDIEIGGAGNKIVPDGYANNTDGYIERDSSGNVTKIHPYKFYVSAIDSSGNYTGEKILNCALHVRDNIRPIGYGKLKEFKNNVECYLPDKSPSDNTPADLIASHSPCFNVDGGSYMTSTNMLVGSLDPRALAADDWTTQTTNGYCANFAPNPPITYNYMATPYLNGVSGNIVTGLSNDPNFDTAVNLGLPPRPVEDNIECQFSVFVNDNCGNATSTLTYRYYSLQTNGVYQEAVNSIISNWTSGAELRDREDKVVVKTDDDYKPVMVNGSQQPIVSGITTSSATSYSIFRGDDSMFPMAIPIVIEAEDNARDWDYYDPHSGQYNDNSNVKNWVWDKTRIRLGGERHNTRIFRTTLPVYGSQLDIRTLDKTIKNSNH